jgi:dihydrofolate synthase/folylpolyglutamate synthase
MPDHARSTDPAVQAQLDRFAQLSPGRDILGLERISALLALLGNPHDRLPPVFHVAGTNGKGSTCAFLRAALEAAGKTVHVYTSPHLVRFNERIRVAGKLIDDEALAPLLAEVLDVAEAHDIGPSFFEATTAAAFLAFSRTPADACVIEVGLGGRLDATNVVTPVVCGIASLGIDHEAFLLAPEEGVPKSPLARIAYEKAGIAKPSVPLITHMYTLKMEAAIVAQAAAAGAPWFRQYRDWRGAAYRSFLGYRDRRGTLRLPLPRMPGRHQVKNALLAIAMLRHQHAVDVPDAALAAAMEWTHWPARLQKMGPGPLTALLSEDIELWLDGGHNDDAGRALGTHFRPTGKKVHLVIGMLANKNPHAIIRGLMFQLASITVVPVPGHEYHDVAAFRDIWTTSVPVPGAAASLTDALRALHPDPETDIVLIAGSLYLAGVALALNETLPQ